MYLLEANFDLIIALLAILTLFIIVVVVIKRKKFLDWFFVLFFASLGGIVYYIRNFYPNVRSLADFVFLFAIFSIVIISLSDYFKFVKFITPEKTKLVELLVLVTLVSFSLSYSLVVLLDRSFDFVIWLLFATLILMSFSILVYFIILAKSFSVTKFFFFLSIFSVFLTNLATDVSFFGSQILWDSSYVLNIISYVFFITCSLTVFFEDQLLKISTDLSEKETIFQTFIELAPVGVALFQNEKIKLVNTSLSKMSGYSIQEIKNWSLDDILNTFTQEDKFRVKNSILRVQNYLNGEFEENFNAKYIRKTGEVKSGEFYVKTTNFQGFPANFVIAIDNTEKIELEEKFKLAFLNSPNPIVLVDGKTDNFIIFNDKFCDMFGYTQSEMPNLNFDNFTIQSDLEIQQKNFPDDMTHREGFHLTKNKKYRRKDGKIIETIVSTSFLKINDKEFFITQLVDISYLNEIEYYKNLITSLEQANNELKSINQIVAHDVKAPLLAIANLLDLIELDFKTNISDNLQTIFSQIKTKTDYTLNLIREILDYSSVGFFEEEISTIETIKILEDLTKLLNIPTNFLVEIDPLIPNLTISKTRIRQVFQNLLSNAIKFNDKINGKIFIGSRNLGNGMYEFFVEDNGMGIPVSEIPLLFNVFKTVKKSPDSSGLGLAIVKKIIQFYGGDVKINSILGSSTVVSFTLPLRYINRGTLQI